MMLSSENEYFLIELVAAFPSIALTKTLLEQEFIDHTRLTTYLRYSAYAKYIKLRGLNAK